MHVNKMCSCVMNYDCLTYRRYAFSASNSVVFLINIKYVPKGIRTPVTAVKGRCPRPLDDGDVVLWS